ncbi:hypothetical protein R1sor_022025 [Riccia sorocarpa]|uniref:Uncharacterized protein n=1 Tax=Riccia sorocarpa TaxID=122646 RepID=A0ABD3GPI1_9MARC
MKSTFDSIRTLKIGSSGGVYQGGRRQSRGRFSHWYGMDDEDGNDIDRGQDPGDVGQRQGHGRPHPKGDPRQSLLPFQGVGEPPRRRNFKEMGVPEPRSDLSIKVWEQYELFKGFKGNSKGVWSKSDDTGQSSRDPLDEEEEIAQALWESRKRESGSDHVESILDPSQQVKSQHSTKNSPSSVATASTPSLSNPGMINPQRKIKIKIKTWDWREPVTEEEVLENMEEDRRRRAEGSVKLDSPTPQRQHHDDLQDYDFPCDENEPLEDASTLPNIDIGDGDTLDEHMNIASLFMRRESVWNYKMVNDVGAAQARAHGVEEDRLKELNSKFGIAAFPKVKLNAPGVELTSKKTRVLQDIYSFPMVRDDVSVRPLKRTRPSTSRFKPTDEAGPSTTPEETTHDPGSPTGNNITPGLSPRENTPSPRTRTLRSTVPVNYKRQLE